jgi:beta-glucosidase
LKLSAVRIKNTETIKVSFQLSNVGKVTGEEVVQLYLQDKFGSVVRPVLELKDFQKIKLNAGESKTIEFTIDKEKLSFYNNKLEWVAESGDFEVMIGTSSADIKLKSSFELVD